MSRVLSSSITFFAAYIVPFIWMAGAIFISCAAFVVAFTNADPNVRQTFLWLGFVSLIFPVAGGALIYVFNGRLKRVAMEGDRLNISNYFTQITVPLSDIENITQNFWVGGRPVTIAFRTATPFGRKVTFLPKPRSPFPYECYPFIGGLSPIVGELRELAAQAKSAA